MLVGVWGVRGYGDDSTHYGWLSSTALLPWLPSFFHRHFPSQSPPLPPSTRLSAVNSSPHPRMAPQSLNSSSQPLCFLGTCIPVPVQGTMCGCSKDCLIFISFKLPHVSCFCLKCFSSDSDNCPDVRIRPLLQFPHPLRAGPILLTVLFLPLFPLSYQVLYGSIYYFPLVRYSCPLSAGVRYALPCLKV